MKPIITVFTGLFLCSFPTLSAQGDQEIIKGIIVKSNQSFYTLNYDAWAANVAQTPYTYFSMATPGGSFRWRGWEAISKGFREDFEKRKSQPPSKAVFTFEDYDIHINGNMAWVNCTEIADGNPVFWHHRVFEKIDGQWKVIALNLVLIKS